MAKGKDLMEPENLRHFIKKHIQILIVGLLFFLAYMPTFLWMWERWFSRDSYYSHGILVPEGNREV